MNHLDVVLAARAHQGGRALRSCSFRHRRIVSRPLAVVVWQLGAEPFSAAAIAWGSRADRFALAVAGEPRNRDLAFAALSRFARWFNASFEAPANEQEELSRGSYKYFCARTVPQVLVANAATVATLGRLGRRLAYLTSTGGTQPDPELVKLGKHLLFLADHSATAGQQQILALTDLLNSHWAIPLSSTERQSLAAIDAYIAPPVGLHGFSAAADAERTPAGPVPGVEDDERLDPMVDEFNARRAGRTDAESIARLRGPIEKHYRDLTQPAWDLIWRCRDREIAYPEAASIARRWDEDRRAYTAHMDWMAKGGLRRTRHTPRRAAVILRTLEDAQQRTEAEEALDDPVRMIPYLLDNKAVRGRVIRVDRDHKEMAVKRLVKRPLVEILSTEPCYMPRGKELFWTTEPDGREFVIDSIQRAGAGFKVTLKLMTRSSSATLPAIGTNACFSIHTTREGWPARLPLTEPWTHHAADPFHIGPLEDAGRQAELKA